MKRICGPVAAATVAMMGALPVAAQERLEINNIYPKSEESFTLEDSIYYMQDNQGIYEVIEAPFEDGPARCVGGGFGYRDGTNDIVGICIFGEGADTFTMSWKAGEQGAANNWTIVHGTGKFKGMTGEGIATTGVEVMYKALPMRQSHIVGMVTIPGIN